MGWIVGDVGSGILLRDDDLKGGAASKFRQKGRYEEFVRWNRGDLMHEHGSEGGEVLTRERWRIFLGSIDRLLYSLHGS